VRARRPRAAAARRAGTARCSPGRRRVHDDQRAPPLCARRRRVEGRAEIAAEARVGRCRREREGGTVDRRRRPGFDLVAAWIGGGRGRRRRRSGIRFGHGGSAAPRDPAADRPERRGVHAAGRAQTRGQRGKTLVRRCRRGRLECIILASQHRLPSMNSRVVPSALGLAMCLSVLPLAAPHEARAPVRKPAPPRARQCAAGAAAEARPELVPRWPTAGRRARRRDRAGAGAATRSSSPRSARAAGRSSCAPTRSKGRPRNTSRPAARSSCAPAAKPCSPTGSATTSSWTRSGQRAACCCARAPTGSPAGAALSPRDGNRLLHRARFYVAENGGRGDAAEIKFVAPSSTKCAMPATRPASRRTRTGTSGPTSSRSTSRGCWAPHNATVRFLGVPIAYSPWLEFPLSNERKTGFLTPTFGSSGTRGFDMSLPYYLNLAPTTTRR